MRGIVRVLGWAVGLFLVFQVVIRLGRKVHPFPIPSAAVRILENPLRARFFPPERLVVRMGVSTGWQVLEVGPGTGFYTVAVARRVGPEGKVYALDIEPKMLAAVQEKIRQHNLTNVETRLDDAEHLPFNDDSFDLVFYVTVLGEIPDKEAALREAYHVLKPGGTLSITEFLPDPDYSLKSTTIAHCEEAGFRLSEQFGGLFSYTVNFRKPR
ncbi:MAG: methyltransferase domain-containing protein [Chloroflexi bacterium]|nr:methyltransferase domain-containing protein [Chloroflexota bacterium]